MQHAADQPTQHAADDATCNTLQLTQHATCNRFQLMRADDAVVTYNSGFHLSARAGTARIPVSVAPRGENSDDQVGLCPRRYLPKFIMPSMMAGL